MEQTPLPLACMISLNALPKIAVEARRDLPESPGIYFVLEGKIVRYIGRSMNLHGRWKVHHRLRDYCEKGMEIAWLAFSNTDLLEKIEQACIDFFHPQDNSTPITRSPNATTYTEVKMTVFVHLDTRRWLKDAARRANTNSSAYIRGLIQEAMRLDLNRKDPKP